MRILFALLGTAVFSGALVAGTPAAAQTFKPAVVNINISPLETLWHVRVALNVAALACRDADEATTVAAYNALIKRHAAVLAVANDAVSARYKAQYGTKWESVRERDMTRLYNFFAQPTAQVDFCRAAKVALMQVNFADSATLITVAADELPALEEPFWSSAPQTQFAGSAPTTVVAAAGAVPVAPGHF